MAFYTDTTSAPLIIDGTATKTRYVSFIGDTSAPAWKQQVTTTRKRWIWLARAAADSIADAKNGDTNTDAASVKMNNAGAYQVRATITTYGAWSLV